MNMSKKYSGNLFKRCFLCGGDHSKDVPLPIDLDCPYCGKRGEYRVLPHCPGGVSHGEEGECPECKKKVFLVVYWDGEVCIQKKARK